MENPSSFIEMVGNYYPMSFAVLYAAKNHILRWLYLRDFKKLLYVANGMMKVMGPIGKLLKKIA